MLLRRSVLASLAASALPASAVLADQRPIRIGWLTAQSEGSLAPYVAAFRANLPSVGLTERRDISIEFRYGDDNVERVPALAAELIALPVRLIVAQGAAVSILARLQLPVPIVYVVSGEPVAAGLATTLARPKGNMTGLTLMAAELNAKRLELLRDILPGLSRVALVGNPEHPGAPLERDYTMKVAQQIGLRLDYYATPSRQELASVLETLKADRPQAISILGDGFALANRKTIIDAATGMGIPVVSAWRAFAESGAVCTYGPQLEAAYKRLASYVERILVRGASAADLPIEQPTQFELVANQRAASALGIKFPPSVLAAADVVLD
jgi:putative ABC transport system substrate-binding protein